MTVYIETIDKVLSTLAGHAAALLLPPFVAFLYLVGLVLALLVPAMPWAYEIIDPLVAFHEGFVVLFLILGIVSGIVFAVMVFERESPSLALSTAGWCCWCCWAIVVFA